MPVKGQKANTLERTPRSHVFDVVVVGWNADCHKPTAGTLEMAERERLSCARLQVKNLVGRKSKKEKLTIDSEDNSQETIVTWNVDQESTELMYEELDVEELKWPDEEMRNSSQEQMKIFKKNRLNSKVFSRGFSFVFYYYWC